MLYALTANCTQFSLHSNPTLSPQFIFDEISIDAAEFFAFHHYGFSFESKSICVKIKDVAPYFLFSHCSTSKLDTSNTSHLNFLP